MSKSLNNGDLVHIREMYEAVNRLEIKIDEVDRKVENIMGKASILALVWSSIVTIGGIVGGRFLK